MNRGGGLLLRKKECNNALNECIKCPPDYTAKGIPHKSRINCV